MSSSFFKIIYHTFIVINLFFIITCYEEGVFYKEEVLKLTLNNNGYISKDTMYISSNEIKIVSIAFDEKLVLYEYDNSVGNCSIILNHLSNSNEDDALEDCMSKKPNDNENFVCFLNMTYKIDEENISYPKCCIEVNKYEKDRFKGITLDKYLNFNLSNIDNDTIIGHLSCDSTLYKINKLIFYFLFIYIFLNK